MSTVRIDHALWIFAKPTDPIATPDADGDGTVIQLDKDPNQRSSKAR